MSFDVISVLSTLIAVVAISIGLFLVLRRLTLWYFRINEMADNLAVIADHYRSQRQAAAPRQQSSQPTRPAFTP